MARGGAIPTGSRPFVTRSAAGVLSPGRGHCLKQRLGFLKDERDDFEDLVDVSEDADEQGWVPCAAFSTGGAATRKATWPIICGHQADHGSRPGGL
jgi:hypothetical protein